MTRAKSWSVESPLPGTPSPAREDASTVTVKDPLTPAGRKTDSVLFRMSDEPPVTEVEPLKTLPRYVLPPTVTVKSRSLTQGAPEVGPGASVQTKETRKGTPLLWTVPLTARPVDFKK